MAEIIRMPRMSDTMEEGIIVNWLKKEGEEIESGETLAEVETDKATMELDSYFDGVLLHIAVKEGTVPIDGIIAVIGEKGEDWEAAIAVTKAEVETGPIPPAVPALKQEVVPEVASVPSAVEPVLSGHIKASPLAKNMAKSEGIDLSAISGTGDQGRIVKRDIDTIIARRDSATISTAAVQDSSVAEKSTVQPFSFNAVENSKYTDKPVSQMRKVIARRLGESKFSAPHFYLTIDINMDNAIKIRKKLNEAAPVRISFNDLVLKAAAAALKLHPAVNSSWLGDKIRFNHEVNIGVAVAVADGLLVPVINYADMKSLSQINVEVRELAGKAKNKRLQPAEMQGNTFTVSNLGMFDIEEFTAIINPPDACIMAVGAIMKKPVIREDSIVIGNQMKVTLSADHRAVDGSTGALFLRTFKEILEDPIRLLV